MDGLHSYNHRWFILCREVDDDILLLQFGTVIVYKKVDKQRYLEPNLHFLIYLHTPQSSVQMH